MKRIFVYFLVLLASFVATSTLAQAQATRTWVSGVGDDANPCSRTAPCKTFAGAISKTAAGGEINALDPAGFGAVTITKAITLDGGGGQVASILVAGTNGVIINAGVNDTIILRNLRFNGLNGTATPGLNGIRFLAGKQLIVDNCEIFGFSQNGIDVALAAAGDLTMRNTIITNTGLSGINLATSSGNVHASLSNVAIRSMLNGITTASSTVSVDLSSSSIVGATSIGLNAVSGSISAEGNMISKNATAIKTHTFGTIRLSNNSIFDNPIGIACGAGVIASAGNNRNSDPNGAGDCAPGATLSVQ